MADDDIGSLSLGFTADYSELDTAFAQMEASAKEAGAAITDSFTTAASGSGAALDTLGGSVDRLSSATEALATDFPDLAEGLKGIHQDGTTAYQTLNTLGGSAATVSGQISHITEEASQAAGSTNNWGAALASLNAPLTEAEHQSDSLLTTLLKFGGISLTLGGLKSAVEESFASFARVERATESFEALLGSAKAAQAEIEEIEKIAQQDALSFPAVLKADQQMRAFGLTSEQTRTVLQLAADAGVATGRGFDATSSSLTRVIEAGTASNRVLVGLGTSTTELADVMGVGSGEAAKYFKSLDEATRIEVVSAALSSFSGLAQKTANDLTGSWQQLKNEAEKQFAGIGAALAPAGRAVVDFAREETQQIGGVVTDLINVGKEFGKLPDIVGQALAAVAMLRFTSPMAALGIELIQLGLAWKGYQQASDDADAATRKANDGVALIAASEHQRFSAYPEYNARFNEYLSAVNSGAISQQDFTKKTQELNTEFFNLHPNLVAAKESTTKFTDEVAKLKTQLDSHQITQTQYNEKLKELIKSHSDLAPKILDTTNAHKGEALSLEDLVTKNVNLNTQLGLAQSVYDQVTARVKAGSGEYNLQTEALKQLDKVLKQLGESETNVDVITATTIQKNADLTDKLTAQWQSLVKLEDEYGTANGITLSAQKQFESLAGQLGLTRGQFEDLVAESDTTGESLIELVNQAVVTAGAFKDLGINSSAHLKNFADKAHEAYQRITDDGTSSPADIEKAWQKAHDADVAYANGTSVISDAFHALGLKSNADIEDMRAVLTHKFELIRDSGTAAPGEIGRAWQALQEKLREAAESIDPVTQAFKALGVQSSDELYRLATKAQQNFETISGSGRAGAGALQQAAKVSQDAWDKYYTSLSGLPAEHEVVGRTGRQAGEDIAAGFGIANQGLYGFSQNLTQLEQQIGAMDKAFQQFAQNAGSFGSKIGATTAGGGAAGGSSGGGGSSTGGSGMNVGTLGSYDLSSQSYDQLWEDYTRNVGLSTTSPGARQLAQLEYQELQKRWAKGDFGTGAAGAAKTPASSTPAPPAAATGGAGAAPTVSGGMGGTAAPTGSTMGPATGAAGVALTESNPYAGTPSFGQGPSNELGLPPITPIGLGGGTATMPGMSLTNLPTVGTGGTAAAGSAAATPGIATSISTAAMGRVPTVPIPTVAVDTGVYAQPTYSTPSAAAAPAAVPQTADTSKMQWLGGLSPTSTIASAAIPTAGGTGAMSLAEMQAALGIVPAPAGEANTAVTEAAAKAALSADQAKMATAAGAAPAIKSGVPALATGASSAQLPEISSVLDTFSMALEKAVSGFAHSTTAAAAGNAGGKQIIVNINNPTVSNQSDIDKMVKQLQDVGMLVN